MMDAMRAQNALMEGQARFEKWQAEFKQKWAAPMQRATLKQFFARLPAEAKDQLRAQDPEQYAKLEKFINQP